MSKIREQQSTLCYTLNHYKTEQICQQRKTLWHIDNAHTPKFTIAQ